MQRTVEVKVGIQFYFKQQYCHQYVLCTATYNNSGIVAIYLSQNNAFSFVTFFSMSNDNDENQDGNT